MATKQKVSKWVLITALVVLGFIQLGAFHYGIDGTFRSIITGLIALIVGVQLPQLKVK